MDIGIGLPATIPGVEGRRVLDWAGQSEERGFASLGTVDRLVYPNYEPLVTLAAAAAVTERVELVTTILIVPWRANTALLAKQAATIDHLSGGRLVLGVAVGQREDDFEVSGVPHKERGARMDEMLEQLKLLWAGQEVGFAGGVGPESPTEGGPRLIMGGQVDAAFKRAAKYAEGWVAGGTGPDAFKEGAAELDKAWGEEGRSGSPRKMAIGYYALGPDAEKAADWYIHHYYEWLGSIADMMAAGVPTDEQAVKETVDAYAAAGCDELILFPCSAELDQVDLLAQAVL
jgi:alkanesulfonate monooxygenase SsuD/methylene tetrahydromethanopterin reductase-like flavin-dependent oxidoreductase (luciferase family)